MALLELPLASLQPRFLPPCVDSHVFLRSVSLYCTPARGPALPGHSASQLAACTTPCGGLGLDYMDAKSPDQRRRNTEVKMERYSMSHRPESRLRKWVKKERLAR